jgi:hypothetical protein
MPKAFGPSKTVHIPQKGNRTEMDLSQDALEQQAQAAARFSPLSRA